MSLYFLGGDPIPYIGLVPIDPRSSNLLKESALTPEAGMETVSFYDV